MGGPSEGSREDRRRFLRTAFSAAGVALVACATRDDSRGGRAERDEDDDHDEEGEVTPGEDLMQEHGVLERVLLVYDEAIRRIDHHEALHFEIVARAGGIVRRFVEDYHEKLEEQFVFPRLSAASREVELVAVLLRQHERGRQLTDRIMAAAHKRSGKALAPLLRSFNRMYRPHAAREDTVIFPAFRALLGRAAYRKLGEQFEEKEEAILGDHGFESVVGEVAELERALGIHDLARFTPA